MLKIGILDDNREHLEYTYQQVKAAIDQRGISCQTDKSHELSFFENQFKEKQFDYDVLFWDICMDKGTSLQLARDIFEVYPHIQMVYVTSYDEYIKEVFHSNVSYFVDKKDLEEKMDDIMNKVMDVFMNQKLFIKNKDSVHIVNMHDIMYIERKLRTSYINEINNHCYNSREKLSELICKLNHKFMRIHNSFIVNIDYIETVTRTSVHLINGMTIPISRQYYSKVKERLFM